MGGPTGSDWQQVIWRTWRNTDDRALATYLLDLVVDGPVGPWPRLPIGAIGAVAGAFAGLLVGLFASQAKLLPWTLGGALAGECAGLLFSRRLTWGQWLARLSPDEGTEGGGSARALLRLSILGRRAGSRPRLSAESAMSPVLTALAGLLFMLCGGPAFGTAGVAVGGALAAARISYIGGLAGTLLILPPLVVLALLGELGMALLFLARPELRPLLLRESPLSWSIGGIVGGLAGFVIGALCGLSAVRRSEYAWEWRALWSWWREMPRSDELEAALRQACAVNEQARERWSPLLSRLEEHKGRLGSPADLVAALQHGDWEQRFIARHALAALGGEAVERLEQEARDSRSALRRTALWLLDNIADETAARLAGRANRLLCPRCMARCGEISVNMGDYLLTYYGCRSCGQSREFLEWPGEVAVVLDSRMEAAYRPAEGILWVNGLRCRLPPDAHRIDIAHATDEEVERFAVLLANDTNPERQVRYRNAACYVEKGCSLSENTLRILERLFGRIESAGP